jgi:hypothetical protein
MLAVIGTWLLSALILAVFMLTVTSVKRGGIKSAIEYYKMHPTYKDWIIAGVVSIAGVILLLVSLNAIAEDHQVTTLEYTRIYFGLDYQNEAPECQVDGPSKSWTANGGIDQHIVGWTPADILPVRFDITAGYLHHSCAINEDATVYDGFGAKLNMTINW